MAEFNLGAEVSLDTDPIKASKTTIEKNLKQINKSLRKQRQEFKKNEMSIEQLADREKDLGKAVSLQQGLLKKRKDDLQNVRQELSKSNQVTEEQKLKLQSASRAVKQAESQLNSYINELKETELAHKQFNRTTDRVKNSLGELRDRAKMSEVVFKQSARSVNDYENHLSEMNYTITKSKGNLSLLHKNLKEVSRTHGSTSRQADNLRNAITKETIAMQIAQGRADELGDELDRLKRKQRGVALSATLMGAGWAGARDSMDRIATTLRSVGEVAQGVVGGIMVSQISNLVPILGSVISLTVGLGGMLVSASGGAIGLAGSYSIALAGVMAFTGQATYALKMLEDGTLNVTNEVKQYQSALKGLKGEWEGLIAQNQASIFNTMTNGISIARKSLSALNPFLTKTAQQIELFSKDMLKWVSSSQNAKNAFKLLNTTGVSVFQNLINAGKSSINGLSNLFVQFGPLIDWVGKGIENLSNRFDKWANSASTNKGIANFINYTKQNLPIVGSIFGNIFKGIFNLFNAFSGHSVTVLKGIQGVTEGFKNWSAELKKSDGFKQFVSYLETNGPKVWELIKNITTALWGLIKGMAPVGSQVLNITKNIMGWVSSMTNAHPEIGKFVGGLTAIGGAGLLLAKPILMTVGAITKMRGALLAATGAQTLFGSAGAIASLKMNMATKATKIWTGVTKVATATTKALGFAIKFMTGPVGLVITGIVALVAIIIHLWKTNDSFRNAVINIWNKIQSGIMFVVNGIKKGVPAAFTFIKSTGIAIWNTLQKSVVNLVKALATGVRIYINTVKVVVSTVFNAAKNIALKIWNAIKTGVVKLVKLLVAGIRLYITTVKTVVSTVFNAAKNISIKVWTTLKNSVLKIVKLLWTGVRNTFNALKKGVTTIFNSVKSFSIKVWNTVKNGVIKAAKLLWRGMKIEFTLLKKGVTIIFNAVKKFTIKVWNTIKNRVVSFAKSLWSGVRNIFNSLRKGVSSIFNTVKNISIKVWTTIKNKVVSFAKSLWTNVRRTFNSLKKGVSNIFNSVKNNTVKSWNTIKSKITGIASSIWKSVKKTFNNMKNGLGNIIDKIKDHIDGMVNKVKKGLNKLIGGVNWVGKKLGMKKIPEFKFHTGTTHTNTTQNIVKNGKIARDTFATVGDKGKGNGPGGFRHEMIRYPNGKTAITPNRDTTAFLPQGSTVYNGAQTYNALSNTPEFSKGTLPRFHKGTKKNLWDKTKDKVGDFGEGVSKTAHGVKKNTEEALKASVEAVGKGKKWLSKKVGDVMDWVGKPGKLLNKILDGFGVNMNAFGIDKGTMPFGMMKGMFKKLKDAAKNLISRWMEEAEGGSGDASWLFKHDIWQKFGAYTGGLSFNGGKHYGMDFGMTPGTPVYAVKGGKAKVFTDYGGGKSVQIKTGANEWNWYMHLSKQIAKTGDMIKAGQKIALSGNTGAYTKGSGHLHFQLMKGSHPGNDTAINPEKWLKSLKGGGKKSASKWRSDIVKASKEMGVNLSGGNINDIISLINTESSGDPGVTQSGYTDVNTGGNEARGLLQYTPGTWNGYKKKGKGNILNGYHQLLAFFNNSNWRRDLASWKARMSRGQTGWGPTGSRRFANGTNNAPKGLSMLFEKGGEILNLRGGEQIIPNDVSIAAIEKVINGDIFNKVQSSVYDAISMYADELRNRKERDSLKDKQIVKNQREEIHVLREQTQVLKDMYGTLVNILSSNEDLYNKELVAHIDPYGVEKSVNKVIDKRERTNKRINRQRPVY